MTATVQRAVHVILVALCLILAGAAFLFHMQASKATGALYDLKTQVAAQSLEVERQLLLLTAERDAKQAELEALYEIQERKDADAQAEITRLANELELRPVRVRYVSAPGGRGGGGSQDHPPASFHVGKRGGAEANGVLPEENARSLRQVIAEAEEINAAYSSCRVWLLSLHDAL